MSLRVCVYLVVATAVLASCTKTNPDVCCVGAEDCAQFDIQEDVPCSDGLTCVNNDCVMTSCETEGCPVTQPVCNVVSGMCEGCADATDCTLDATTPVCNVESGMCVGCVTNADCGGTTPICDATQCRGCTDDIDCESGACGDDGSCVPEADIAYVARTGIDVVPCSRQAPCVRVQFAASTLGGARRHIVMFPGDYEQGAALYGRAELASMVLHGGGSSLNCEQCGDGLLTVYLPLEVRHLSIANTSGLAIYLNSAVTLRDVRVRGRISNSGDLTIDDSLIDCANFVGIENNGTLTARTTELVGGTIGIRAYSGSLTTLENVRIHGMTDAGIDNAMGGAGTVSFSTITNTGTEATDARGVRCSVTSGNNFRVQSSIIWAPQQPTLPAITNCRVEGSLVGPIPFVGDGNISSDPQFANAAAGDLHISTTSPAKDRATQGPAVDFEGDPRPSGSGFDLGADETQ